MIARIGWIAALLALALVTTFAQMDRSARFNPVLATLVPAPFRGFAQAQLAGLAVQAQDGTHSRELARDLVRVRPMPAENLTLLAQAGLLAGDVDGGLAALELAGQRGWREPFSQRALAQSALLLGNVDAASLRISALLATGALDRSSLGALVSELTSTPAGRQALAQRLADGGHWQRNFVASAVSMIGPENYADLIVRARALDARLDCASLSQAAQRLRKGGHEALAEQIDNGDCSPG